MIIDIDNSNHSLASHFNPASPINMDEYNSLQAVLDTGDIKLIKSVLYQMCKQVIDSIVEEGIESFKSDEHPRVAAFINLVIIKLKEKYTRTLALFIDGNEVPVLITVDINNAVIEVTPEDAMTITEAQDWVDS